MRIGAAIALVGALVLGGCSTFDPIDAFQDWDLMGSSKKPLPGERRAVFPEGVPGVPQGVPPDMVKGYQPPAEAPPPVIEAQPPRQKAKKTASAPPPRRAVPKRQPRQEVQQDEQPVQQAPAAARTQTQPVQGQGGWQQMPGSQPTWPTNAQPAPQR
jgi:hypothetical protein